MNKLVKKLIDNDDDLIEASLKMISRWRMWCTVQCTVTCNVHYKGEDDMSSVSWERFKVAEMGSLCVP